MRRVLTLLLFAAAVPAWEATATVPATLSISNAKVVEGVSGITQARFQVRLVRGDDPQAVVKVNWTTQDLTATAGSDYLAASGQLVFPVGVARRDIVIDVFGDELAEGTEVFFVKLYDATDALVVITNDLGHGLIEDDDPHIAVQAKCDLDHAGRSGLLVLVNPDDFEGGAPVIKDWPTDATATAQGTEGVLLIGDWPGGSPWTPIAMDDFDGDHACDVLWERDGQLALSLTGLYGPPHTPSDDEVLPPYPLQDWSLVGSGPFNNDRKADLLWWNSSNRTLQVWLWDTGPEVHALTFENSGIGEPIAVLRARDAITGILWRHPVSGALTYWRMRGLQLVDASQVPYPPNSVIGLSWRPAAVGDFDGDGIEDLVWQEPVGPAGQTHPGAPLDSGGRAAVWFLGDASQVRESLMSPARLEMHPGVAGILAGPR